MTSAVSLTRLSAKPYAAPRGSRKVAAGPVPQGGQGCLTTARVNGGASAFGIYLYLCVCVCVCMCVCMCVCCAKATIFLHYNRV